MVLLSAAWLTATWRGVRVFADSASGKLSTLLAGSCSATSPSSYYLLHVPGISSLKQGHRQESHTYFFVPHPRVQQRGRGWCFFFSLHAMAWPTPLKTCSARRVIESVPCNNIYLHGSILHLQNNSAHLTASFAC